ncbi:DUF1049 domain-containing protein [Arthrobacter sp. UKPF54-2]|uniref:LapA family protein n=1 Tax=Arthrobacter sp. UKPF54-2 TaxID=2600159 RepID=UPI0011B121F2|nr:lipopolysaccharide assembly protein LapA domain-containing protein [Arthrobacter sp. UKPF54-2]QDY90876.1 DUF1049 domain-containing protein [Arthrobacter sp. UKPF54-2]
MTQTPRGFGPQDPNNAPSTPNPATAATPSGSREERYRDGGPDSGASRANGASADAVVVSRPEAPPASASGPTAPAPEPHQVTRAGMVWAAVASALVVLILLIVFILQNQVYVQVKFFGLEGSVPLGIALFIAAVGGGVLVAIAGAARIIQLRRAAHRQRVRAGQFPKTR